MTLLLLLPVLLAAPPVEAPLGPGVSLPMRDASAAAITTDAVRSPAFWSSAEVTDYTGETYDQIRLRPLTTGYFSLITGEEDFPHETVVSTTMIWQDRLPAIEEEAIAIEILGEGIDETNGLPYVDTLFFLDFTIFYGIYIQRTYRLDVGDHTFAFFETVRQPYVSPQTWARYQARREALVAGAELRWVLNRVIDVEDVFGTFIVEPGEVETTRVSFLVRVVFGAEAGSLARWAGELPLVLKVGLQSGFDNCVQVAAASLGR